MDDQHRADGAPGEDADGRKAAPTPPAAGAGAPADPASSAEAAPSPAGRHQAAPIGTLDLLQMAVERERRAPSDENARRVLIRYERWLAAQTAQLGRQRWRDYVIAIFVLGMIGLGSLFVWDASRVRGVVVEPFAVPPDLAERGLAGPVVATHVLDRLATLQAETESVRAPSTYANDWGGDIAVEIPSTGVSLGELRRYLRQWLGNQTRLSGEVVRLTDGRLAVITRVGSKPSTRVEGTEAELDSLLQQGAEAIYAETQPYRHALWLSRQGADDFAEASRRLEALTRGDDLNERLWALIALANRAPDAETSEQYLQAALRLDPDFVMAKYALLVNAYNNRREARAHRLATQLLANTAAARRQLSPRVAQVVEDQSRIIKAVLEADYASAARLAEAAISITVNEATDASAPVQAALGYAFAHDPLAARRVLREHGLATPEALAARLEVVGWAFTPDLEFHRSTGDHRAFRDRGIVVLAALAARGDDDLLFQADLAAAQAQLGEIDAARAVIAPTPLSCAACVRSRGLIEAYAGNPRGADHWLSEAVRIAPDLPAAHLARAEAWLVRRDPARAIAQLELAVQKGPRWADPRKLWGDALMMQGRPAAAVVRYREAAALAPRWGRLHAALGRAQAAAGDRAGALQSFRTAAALDLNPADRADVARRLAAEGAGAPS